MIGIIKNIKIEDVSVVANNDSVSSVMSVLSNITVSSNYSNTLEEQISKNRVRMIVCFSKDTAKSLDYISQRYNEFHSDQQYRSLVNVYNYNKFIAKSLGNNNILSNNSFLSPFASNSNLTAPVFRRKYTKIGAEANLPNGVMLYDVPLSEAVPRDSSGNVEKNIVNSGSEVINLKEISLSFDNSKIDYKNLSLYLYVYRPGFSNRRVGMDFSITTGMSHVDSVCLVGEKTFYAPISTNKVKTGPTVENIQLNLDSNILSLTDETSLSTSDFLNVEDYISPRDKVFGSSGTRKNDVRKVISSSNYFSALWVNRDRNNNNKLLFAVDLASYFSDNSSHPGLYENKELLQMMISGGTPLSPSTLSSIENIVVYRRSCSTTGFGTSNSLGTSSRNSLVGPNDTFPRIPLAKVKTTDVTLRNTDNDNNSIQFFEVVDTFNTDLEKNNQIAGNFRYEVEITFYDGSCKLLRNIGNRFLDIKSQTNKIYQFIVNTEDITVSNNGVISTGLRQIYLDENSPDSAYDTMAKLVTEYNKIINYFNNTKEEVDFVSAYIREMDKRLGRVNVSLFENFMKLVQSGVDFIEKKLEKTYPNNPYGHNQDMVKRSPDRGSLGTFRNTISTINHVFTDTVEVGKNKDFGITYVPTSLQDDSFGFISTIEYNNHRTSEFRKYFQSPGTTGDQAPSGSFSDSSYAYFTPAVISTPNRENIVQTSFAKTNNTTVEYDLDRYGLLFNDLVKINYKVDNNGQNYPNLSGMVDQQTKSNRLFSNSSTMLMQKHGVTFTKRRSLDFPTMRVKTGPTMDTTFTTADQEKCGQTKGLPLIATIVGGLGSLDSQSYIDRIETAIKEKDKLEISPSLLSLSTLSQRNDEPLNISMSLLGKLETSSETYINTKENKSYNSMTSLRKVLGINELNVSEMLAADPIVNLPNQIKNLLAITSTSESLPLTEGSTGPSLEPCRPKIKAEGSNTIKTDLVSVASDDPEGSPYKMVNDPMKSFTNFFTFWMNYKDIACVEYLDSFGALVVTDETYPNGVVPYTTTRKLGLTKWRKMTSEVMSYVNSGEFSGKILCRVRKLEPNNFVDMFGDFITPDNRLEVSEFFELNSSFSMPIYDQYFYLGQGQESDEEQIISQSVIDDNTEGNTWNFSGRSSSESSRNTSVSDNMNVFNEFQGNRGY